VAPLRVAFVTSGAQLGGEERYLSLVLDNLGEQWIAGIVTLEHGPVVERLRAAGHDVRVVPTGRRAGIATSAVRLRLVLRSLGPDVVHANGVKAALTSTLAGVAAGPPVVWVKHDFSWDGLLARLVAGRARAVVGVSEAVTRTFDGRFGSRVRVVHNALPRDEIDHAAGRSALLTALGEPNAHPVVVIVGRLDPVKGHREVIAALPGLRARFPQLRLAVIGPAQGIFPDYEQELRVEAQRTGVGDAVAFLGYREDAAQLVSGADAVVIPTVVDERGMGMEGFSFVALEAMAGGTPVVGYAHGALPEILGDCAVLVPPGDRDALAAALGDVLASPQRRERLAACGQARFQAEFSVARMIDELQDAYRVAAKAAR
jgi:glycosyltransferase involved in cell wall biosynthesis